jgi:hypothetical protein
MPVVRAAFDDPNLVSCAGLVPAMRLADRAGLHDAVTDRVRLPTDKGANPAGKLATIVAGMLAGADSINDLNIARHGGMWSPFTGVYAPSTLGSFMRTFTHGHVRQLQAAARDILVGLAGRVPLLDGAEVLTFVDIDPLAPCLRQTEAGHRVRPCQGRRLQRLVARLQPADRHDLHTAVRAGDRRDPAAFG